MEYIQASLRECKELAELAIHMWSSHTIEELEKDFGAIIESGKGAIFLLKHQQKSIGFAQCSLRYDYVEGTNSSPVAYLEGIYIQEEYRKLGLARGLLEQCENWAKQQGCTQFASDCELDNETSYAFHLKVGFLEANRVICFTKEI